MKTQITETSCTLWLSSRNTSAWANKPGASWPCSTLAGKRLCASFDSNGLCNLSMNGRDAPSIDGAEFSALCSDSLTKILPADHPLFFLIVGQFQHT